MIGQWSRQQLLNSPIRFSGEIVVMLHAFGKFSVVDG
jgi:hypothetical protein